LVHECLYDVIDRAGLRPKDLTAEDAENAEEFLVFLSDLGVLGGKFLGRD
jgi:hypothetical protein